jgi:iron(III) transport system permease protein
VIAVAIAAFLLAFLVLPVVAVVYTAFADQHGGFTLAHFAAFMQISLMRESFVNSLWVAGMTVLWATLIAVPLAYFTTRFQFRGAILIQTLGVVPLIMPAFVGAAALQLIFGRSGSLNLLLKDAFGVTLPVMEGLNGVIFVETLHYFPFILLNLSAALANIDASMEEAAQNLGCSGWRLFLRVVFPLALPGYVAGASLVFIKVFDDLGTPLVLNVTNMLAPQAYLRVTSIGLEDPIGYVICVLLVLFSIAAMGGSWWFVKRRDYAIVARGLSAPKRLLTRWQSVLAYGWIGALLLLVLSPHLGLLLMSLFKVWSFSVLPEQFTLQHYATVFQDARHMIVNTFLYCGLAALLDVLLGTAIAYIVLRTRLPGRQVLDHLVTVALAMPGLVLGIGYLRVFKGVELPFGMGAFTASWMIFVVAYAVRRLPYALRAAMAALSQVHPSLEEAAQNLGASRLRVIVRVVVPLMSGGMLAGFVTSFITAAGEISETILLTSREGLAPMSYGIYLYMQSIAGRGPGAALGIVAIVLIGLGTYLSHRIVATGGRK